MKVIYIAGPYNAFPKADCSRHHAIQHNINEASRVAMECWRKGWAVICPHMNTANFHNCGLEEEAFVHGGLELVRRSDAILMINGWTNSRGACLEYDKACRSGIAVFYLADGIPAVTDLPRSPDLPAPRDSPR